MLDQDYELEFDTSIPTEISVDVKDSYGYSIGEGFGGINGEVFDLHFIHVLPRFSRSGIGSEIFATLTAVAKEKGALRLTGHFSPLEGREEQARAFYQRMGVEIDQDGLLYKNL